ncbi:MAG: TetR/AcrR family transcriptional regulator [Deltaproteobacteria bacterium]|nr:TetR/AcrR family transcriptional regulator [Deltaproteobacteria bacterium]
MTCQRLTAEKRREQILCKVKELCAKKGFAGTTLDEIAKAAGVSRALIVQHFGGKEKLYEALIDYLFRDHPMEKDPQVKTYANRKDDRGVFMAYCEHAYNYMVASQAQSPLRLVMFSMLEKPDLYRKHFQNRKVKGIKVLEEYISCRIKDGVFREVDPFYVAVAFSSMVTQLLIDASTLRTIGNKKEFLNITETMVDLLLNGLRKGRGVS